MPKHHYYDLHIISRYGQTILQGRELGAGESENDAVHDLAFLYKEDLARLGQEFVDAIESSAQYRDY